MTNPATPAAAGWYPAPDGSPAPWWWDGTQWSQPNQQSTLPVQPVQPVAVDGAIAKLSVVTRVLLAITAGFSVVTIGMEILGLTAVQAFVGGDYSAGEMFEVYDSVMVAVNLLASLSLIATAVLWCIWQYRAARQVVGQTRLSPKWHVWSWVIPVVSLWFPFRNISDLWKATGRRRPAWQIVWWLLWIVGNITVQISSRVAISAESFDDLQLAMGSSILGEVLTLGAAVLAWFIVRGITNGLTRNAGIAGAVPNGQVAVG